MAHDLKSPEGDPLIDLLSMGEEEVLRLLSKRLVRHNINLFLFITDSSQVPLWPSPHRSREWIVQELVKLAEYRKIPVKQLFDEVGASLNLFSDHYLSQAHQFVREKEAALWAEVDTALSKMDEATLRTQAAMFFELALHSKEDVTTFLKLSSRAADRLGLHWAQMVQLHSAWEREYEAGIREHVDRQGGVVTLEDYYHRAMFGPLQGVYTGRTAQELIGFHPDSFFVTSSENKVFQALLARSLRPLWEGLGFPSRFDVVEMGAGNGSLAEGILKGVEELAERDPEWARLKKALQYHIVEISPALAEKQAKRLARFEPKVRHHIQSAVHGSLPRVKSGVFLSNELVDMFSPTKLIHFEDELYEVQISGRGGFLQECLVPLRPEVQAFLDRQDLQLYPGEVFYIQREIEEWVQNLSQSLEKGYVLTVDYGNHRDVLRDLQNDYWMRCFYGLRIGGKLRKAVEWFGEIARRVEFPFNDQLATYMESSTGISEPKDMTLFIDFTTLENSAVDFGFSPLLFTSQTQFLNQVADWTEGRGEKVDFLANPQDRSEGWVEERERLFEHYGKFRVSLLGKGIEAVNPFTIPPSHPSP